LTESSNKVEKIKWDEKQYLESEKGYLILMLKIRALCHLSYHPKYLTRNLPLILPFFTDFIQARYWVNPSLPAQLFVTFSSPIP